MANEVRNLVVNGTTYPVGGFLVTITVIAGATTTYTADKTAQEIYDALEAGSMPVIKSGESYYPMKFVYSTGNSLSLHYTDSSSTSILLYASSMSGYPSYSKSGGGSND